MNPFQKLALKQVNRDSSVHRGTILRILYSKQDFAISIMEEESFETIKLISKYSVSEGDHIIAHGRWVNNSVHGWQFQSHCMEEKINLDTNGLIKFLTKNPDIEGIGIKKATMIVENFPDNFDDIITNHPERIINLGISKKIVKKMSDVWNNKKEKNQMIVNLSAFPLTQVQIIKLINKFGNDATDIINKNPYLLSKHVESIGFKTADKIALENGISKNSPNRMEAALDYITGNYINNNGGHSWIEYNDLTYEMHNLLSLDTCEIIDYINKGDCKSVISYTVKGVKRYTNKYIYDCEEYVLKYVLENSEEISTFQYNIDKFDLDGLNDKQKLAVLNSFRYNFTVVTGKAGTGKTFVLSYIIKAYESLGQNVVCAAPTGKATRRLSEMTGRDSVTIHRLLGFDSKSFKYNISEKLEGIDVLIIDEFSMVDIRLAYSLLSAVEYNTKIIISGDHNQLKPISAGNLFNNMLIYHTQKNDNLFKITELTHIVRQAGNLKKNSVEILDGKINFESSDDWKITFDGIFDSSMNITTAIATKMEDCLSSIGYETEDVQVISPMKMYDCGTIFLNKKLQQSIQKSKYDIDIKITDEDDYNDITLYVHDRVIQTSNDYNIDVMNGTLGYIDYISEDGDITIKFEDGNVVIYEKNDILLKNITLAYALTIHKTQGSEFPCVIVAIHSSQSIMLTRNLLYTAVTRAKDKVIILGDVDAIHIALNKHDYHDIRNNFDYILSRLI